MSKNGGGSSSSNESQLNVMQDTQIKVAIYKHFAETGRAPSASMVAVNKGARLPYAKFPRDPNGANGENEVVTQAASTGTFANTSTRAGIANGENQLIAGFIIAGAGSKQILIRGLGPSLAAFGLTGTLQDPILDLRTQAGTNITLNDNWALAVNAAQIPSNLRPTDPRESAIWTTLAPGSYTAIESGKSGATGKGLLEVYDVDYVASSQLANISTRGFAGTDSNVMIGGSIVRGGASPVIIWNRPFAQSLRGSRVNFRPAA